jgi:autotransporter strand-loop-strand O-heptosyltransferase|tara:strand:- start:406 stop:1605 length:1200 start_codon:yes stop_codon:yes gene_type:complete
MKEVLIKEYNNLKNLKLRSIEGDYTFKVNFINGCTLEILGEKPGKFKVQFINQDNNSIVYESEISNNMWCKSNKKYYLNYLIQVINLENNEIIFKHIFNAEGKKVYIHLDSNAIGDTLAWFPYIEEFRKNHKCQVICSTFHNSWFNLSYPEIEFIKPGTEVMDLYAMYTVGWHYNEDNTINTDCNPQDFKKYSLQECSADILGIDYNEIKPNLTFKNTGTTIDGKYVVIAPHGSSHAKYWNYPGGWQVIIDYLNGEGYKVVMITKEPLGDEWHDSKLGGTLTGVIDKTGDYSLADRANDMMNAEFFIGIGSGLSWLNWALNKKTILISGFSAPFSEFKDCERVFTPFSNACNSCYNKVRLDAGDWEWCPEYKDTNRQFECTKTINPTMIIKSIERVKNS